MSERPRWTITALTIPEREPYVQRLLESLESVDVDGGLEIRIIVNRALRDGHFDVEQRLHSYHRRWPLHVTINGADTSIAGGRALQLGACRTPLIAFVDDDITMHGDIMPTVTEALQRHPAALIGVPSKRNDTEERFKPRASTPSVTVGGVRWMPIQGMFAAGYTNLLRDLGGFNPRRRYWGEWTELNTRLWRSGYPTGYVMDGGYLRHWEDAPSSPTRNMDGREQHVLWGLLCTAMEYDAVDASDAASTFWQLVEERYLAYSYGDSLSYKRVLQSVLQLMPRIAREWSDLEAFRAETRQHPFNFAPFHPLTRAEVRSVITFADQAIVPYRAEVFGSPLLAGGDGSLVRPINWRGLASATKGLVRRVRQLTQVARGRRTAREVLAPREATELDPQE